ncbi:hypothetical protein C493_15965 [Natronolimnohabitans innermongolicus JCM 12255]|uniref:Uncharacterized protein n=1 Tax=Natronolimnohabitans innermongolicus JCM 12255 TaxID=1227499 RepID=L9WSY7_9EURY|nr:hypothetical protein C493_15965 [Natronolimnohabitans innermongolicus JCM 12255]
MGQMTSALFPMIAAASMIATTVHEKLIAGEGQPRSESSRANRSAYHAVTIARKASSGCQTGPETT